MCPSNKKIINVLCAKVIKVMIILQVMAFKLIKFIERFEYRTFGVHKSIFYKKLNLNHDATHNLDS